MTKTVKLFKDEVSVHAEPVLVEVPWHEGGYGPGLIKYKGEYYTTAGCCGEMDEYIVVEEIFEVPAKEGQ